MYGTVSGGHRSRRLQQARLQRQQNGKSSENGSSSIDIPCRQNRRPKSVFRRLFSLLKQTWTGVKFALESELEDLETEPIHRPHSLRALCKTTRFNEKELKRIYRCFKAECPTGIIKEEAFKTIYCQFFPQGANTSQYAHYVFATLDHTKCGFLHFEDLIHALSTLCRGTLEDKLRWTFSLYDINKDGTISREEMTMVVTAVYELMGKFAEQCMLDNTVADKVDCLFQKMDLNNDGMVSLDEFLECCKCDEDIKTSMDVFETSF